MARKSTINPKIEAMQSKIKEEAEKILHDILPKKAMEFDELYNSPMFVFGRDISDGITITTDGPSGGADGEPPAKRPRPGDAAQNADGTGCFPKSRCKVPANKKLTEIMDILKPGLKQLVEHVTVLKLWIQFLIPKIEDGNNFGVSIQEEMLNEVRTAEGDCGQTLEEMESYHYSRAKMVSKIAKYPNFEDYQLALNEHDDKMYMGLRVACQDIRNQYAGLHDLLMKNIEKIKAPRNSNTHSMY